MAFKVNCERCGTLFSKGEIHNYRGNNLCEDCYILYYMFSQKVSDGFSPDVIQIRRRIPTVTVLQLSTKR